MPSLSTHVLDLFHGKPAHGVKIEVRYQPTERAPWTTIKTTMTNVDGRCDEQIITESDWQSGHYELVFDVGSYFAQESVNLPDPSFYQLFLYALLCIQMLHITTYLYSSHHGVIKYIEVVNI